MMVMTIIKTKMQNDDVNDDNEGNTCSNNFMVMVYRKIK